MPDMPKRPYPHVQQETNRHGKIAFYYREGKGKRVRLKGEYDSPAFKKSYAAAVAKAADEPAPSRHTLAWLIDRYQASAAFKALRPSTQKMRANILKRVAIKSGKAPLKELSREGVAQGRDDRADTPFAAINYLKVMGYLFEWAVDAELMKENIARGVKPPKVKTDGHKPWTDEDIFAFYAHHQPGSQARFAMDLLLYTGLRRSDIYRLGPQHVRDGMIEFRAQKNQEMLYIPIHPNLQQSVDAAPNGHLAYLLTPVHGRPFRSEASFGNWFGKVCAEANVDARAHGLRKKLAQILAEAGNSNAELKARFGWSSDAMAALYIKEANKKKLAKSGAEKLNQNDFAPHLQSGAGADAIFSNENKSLKK